ncbi:conserved hypothetical protein [Vibrio phage 150E35-1]|nr:conserved hypothetical protein [Vibrio phage 150E35-1]
MSMKDPYHALWMLQELDGVERMDLSEIISEDGEIEVTGEGNACWDVKIDDILTSNIEHMKNTFLITDEKLEETRKAASFTTTHTCSACNFDGPLEECEVCSGEITYEEHTEVPVESIVAALNVLGIKSLAQRVKECEEADAAYQKALKESRNA